MSSNTNLRKIYLAGGCFWGTEHFLKLLKGVIDTTAGYANGDKENPSYEEVKKGSGHAETVEVTYDESLISLKEILEMYFKTIDPTSLNKQKEDEGVQYRTGIYYTDEKDLKAIEEVISEQKAKYKDPILTEVLPLTSFYRAEEYHQDYLDKNPKGYCHIPLSLFEEAKNFKSSKE